MEQVIHKVRILESIWRNIFLDYDYLLINIDYNKNKQSNYPGVIFGYFNDTIPIIKNYLNSGTDGRYDCFLQTIGFLQTIYIQQDLIDELLQLFGLQKSINIDKEPNRSLRNELAGHPIRRNKDREGRRIPISYSLFSFETRKNRIKYLKYPKENNFDFQPMEYDTNEVIKRHEVFLIKYLNQIFEKVFTVLKKFVKSLKDLLSNQILFEKKVELIKEKFNAFFDKDKVFSESFILTCWKRKDEHPRYKYAVDLFEKRLKNDISQISNDINNLKFDWTVKVEDDNNKDDDDDTFPFFENIDYTDKIYPEIDNYSLGKLYDNHPVFGVNFFKKKYSDNIELIEELNFMKSVIGTLEYYCSYNYFRYSLLNDQYI